jgi:Domain of unknown function (DUF4189)
MSIIGFRAPIAISAAGVAAVGAVVVALSPVAHADDQWASCAAPANTTTTANTFCLGTPYPDQASADKRAVDMCNYLKNRQCTVVVSFMECGAIAGNGSQWVGGRGLTKEDAEQDALGQLANGKIAKSACITPG